MSNRAPSIRSLLVLTAGDSDLARKVRETLKRDDIGPFARLARVSDTLLTPAEGYFGVEFAEYPGDQNRMINREPCRGFHYLNAGDTYTPTLVLFASGTFAVKCWGDIVERWHS